MYLLIGADFVPTPSNEALFRSENLEALFGEPLLKYLKNARYRIFNLETALAEEPSPIPKCGPNLIAPTETIKAYRALGVNALTLANNHVFDQGAKGLSSTCRTLEQSGITFFGAGESLSEAEKPHVFSFAEKQIGVYACCEHEFGIAEEKLPGANPFEPLESLNHVSQLKQSCDYVIVLYHGGKEHYPYPSPQLQKRCRKLISCGADLVICQHSHCIGCEEKYQNGTIVYGQGNFLFDRSGEPCWDTGLLVSLNEAMEISYTALRREKNTVRLAEKEDAEQILEDFFNRSRRIREEGFVRKQYEAFAEKALQQYLFAFSGVKRGFFYRVFDKLSGYRMTPWLLKRKYHKNKKLVLENFIECEAHRELLLCGLRQEEKNKS